MERQRSSRARTRNRMEKSLYSVYEENKWSEVPGYLELAKNRNAEEGTEGMLIATQEQALRTINIERKFDKQCLTRK